MEALDRRGEGRAPVFYYDLSSFECYLAAERIGAVLPVAPEWEPVRGSWDASGGEDRRPVRGDSGAGWDASERLACGDSAHGRDEFERLACGDSAAARDASERLACGDPAHGRDESERLACGDPAAARDEFERLAVERGLQPVRWPARWPPRSERALRAATYAKSIGRVTAFSLAAFRQAFAGGRDLDELDTVVIAAAACEMHPSAVVKALELRSVVRSLELATARAVSAGVRRLPAVTVGELVFEGDAGLEEAAALLVRT